MAKHDDVIGELARHLGVAPSYRDQNDRVIETSPAAQLAVIEAMGYEARTPESALASLERLSARRASPLPAWMVLESGAQTRVDLPQSVAAKGLRWVLTGEDGALIETREGAGVTLPPLSSGYYTLSVEAGEQRASTFLLVADATCYMPEAFAAEEARGWGLTAQVYGLRSAGNLGMGDLSDVAMLSAAAGRSGASFLGLSPLHALFGADRTKISPYSPSSRLFLETLYIDPRAIDVPGVDVEAMLTEAAPRTDRLRAGGLVDYAAVWEIKRPILEALFSAWSRAAGQDAFLRWREAAGPSLELHATFEALSEHFTGLGQTWPGVWPAEYFDANSAAVGRFRQSHAERISFHAWLQFVADQQLEAAAEKAKASGMEVGLYRDLAVGADRYGSEVWANPERYALSLSVGAPPDPLGPQGQNWGFPPFDPIALEEQQFRAFRDLVVSNMRHAGAIRIDHAYQLQRLFLVPPGQSAAGGAYVAYPFEAMLAVLRIESRRHRCMVIAEDLGTGPKGFSDAIMASGILSYRILSFERTKDGGFKAPGAYPRAALAAITTHDLPTFKGWMRGYDIDLRSCFGVYDEQVATREHAARRQDLENWRNALLGEKLGASFDEPRSARNDALRYLARAPSVLLAIQCEDVLDELNQANLPGPSDGHPNWRRRLGKPIEVLGAAGGALAQTGALMAEERRAVRARESQLSSPPPRATYRLQFHAGFTFDMAREILPYLARLGISHVYASPIQAAQTGSTHGYDVVDPRIVNPELGGEDAFEAFVSELHANGLKLIVDIVPNHMGIGSENPFWFSVLQWGEDSPFADVFDIDWRREGADGKLLLPVLGAPYGEALKAGDLKLDFDAERGAFVIRHHESIFPICPREYGGLLLAALLRLGSDTRAAVALERLARAYATIADMPDAPARASSLERGLAALAREDLIGDAIAATLADVTSNVEALDGLIGRQSYRLAFWRLAGSELNYRRFFEINTLGGVRVEDPRIFDMTHGLILRLVREGKIDGLRVDHIDGLADPGGYLEMLQSAVGPGFYIVAEKILEPGEKMRHWPIAGTTGYDALNEIDGMLLDRSARAKIDATYREVVGVTDTYHDALIAAKKMVLERSFGSESAAIVRDLAALSNMQRDTRDIGASSLSRAVAAFVVSLPVYRTYAGATGADEADQTLVDATMAGARAHVLPGDEAALSFLREVLVGTYDARSPELARRARLRVEQLTGPVMAKSLEDTLFYRHVPWLALNEVGSDPDRFGLSREEFDRSVAHRAEHWPAAMIATSTHDTKRGEDARARMFALSGDGEAWAGLTKRFLDATEGPDANDRYLILQTLIGAWPLEWLEGAPDRASVDAFAERAEAFLVKALREAKRHSNWTDPDEDYESRAKQCLRAILTPGSTAFALLQGTGASIAVAGAMNGMARTVLKATLPGVPDFYQGSEFWDFSLVDPDNRRPIDFARHAKQLGEETTSVSMLKDWRSGGIKQFVIQKLLQDRAQRPHLYAFGAYRPLNAAMGMAYERVYDDERLVVHVPTGTELLQHGALTRMPGAEVFGDAKLTLGRGRWRNLLTGSTLVSEGEVACANIAENLPWLLLGTLHE